MKRKNCELAEELDNERKAKNMCLRENEELRKQLEMYKGTFS